MGTTAAMAGACVRWRRGAVPGGEVQRGRGRGGEGGDSSAYFSVWGLLHAFILVCTVLFMTLRKSMILFLQMGLLGIYKPSVQISFCPMRKQSRRRGGNCLPCSC
ncbi:hypothetical protein BRADI_5g15456v3 [Brachypodium distachyon]|uniref:Uncharacterized protein n=1 Tax=Brachypodium distachyon TaxID=15368 RepID=A0A0Q3IBM9_BRADI|nr:hypothetical protein BRADI_5g15456v3 [Brachypodium distachyon]